MIANIKQYAREHNMFRLLLTCIFISAAAIVTIVVLGAMGIDG